MSYKDRFLKLNLLPLRYRMDLKDLVVIFRYLWFYSIWFLAQDINWDIVLSPAPVVIFIYLFFYPTYFYFF